MTEPTDLPEWDTDEVNSVPTEIDRKTNGWLAPGSIPEKPPFQISNFWQNLVYKWIKWLKEWIDAAGGAVEYDVGAGGEELTTNDNVNSKISSLSLGNASTKTVGNSTGQLTSAGVGAGSTQLTTNTNVEGKITALSLGNASTKTVGTLSTQIPLNSNLGDASTKTVGDATGQLPSRGVGTGGTQLTTNDRVNALIGEETGSWVTVVPENGHTLPTTVSERLQYRTKNGGDTVEFSGLLKAPSATGELMFNLPAAYRPNVETWVTGIALFSGTPIQTIQMIRVDVSGAVYAKDTAPAGGGPKNFIYIEASFSIR